MLNEITRYMHAGRTPQAFGGLVNTPICRGSTILVEDFDSWEASKKDGNPYSNYGRFGTSTTHAFENALVELEGGAGCLVFPSGLAACTHALASFVRAGDHVLITDNIYGPTRAFATQVLTRFGVEVEFFDPLLGVGISNLLRRNTRVVFTECRR